MAKTIITAFEVVNGSNARPAPINARTDQQSFSPNVSFAEKKHIVAILGKAFYDYIITQKNTTPSNYNAAVGALVQAFPTNPDLETLWTEHLLELCATAVVLESLPFIAIQINKGLNFPTPNNGEPAKDDTQRLMDVLRERLRSQKDFILDYLCEKKDLFTLFDSKKHCPDCGCSGEEKRPKNTLGIIFY